MPFLKQVVAEPLLRAMETNRIWSAEQIAVSPDLPGALKEYTKAVIRANPDDVLAFSAEYFRNKAGIEAAPSSNLTDGEIEAMREKFSKYDKDSSGSIDAAELGAFIREDLEYEINDDELEKVLTALDKDGSGQLEFDEVVAWWSDMSSN